MIWASHGPSISGDVASDVWDNMEAVAGSLYCRFLSLLEIALNKIYGLEIYVVWNSRCCAVDQKEGSLLNQQMAGEIIF